MVKTSTLISWFIVIILLGSTLGFAVFFAGGQDGNSNPADQNFPVLGDTTKINFTATGIDANVIDTLPLILIVAETNQAEINLVDSQIYLADQNVRQVVSSYVPTQGMALKSSSALVYKAQISLSPRTDSAKVIDEITRDANYLSAIQAVKSVLVRVPRNIDFNNAQLGLDRNYEFRDRTVESYASMQTRIGDELLVTLNAAFQGNELIEVSGFEEENLSAKVSQKNVSLTAPIASLEPNLIVAVSEMSFSNIAPVKALTDSFAKLDDVNESSFTIQPISPQIMLSVTELGENRIADLNALVLALPDLNSSQTQKVSMQFSALLSFKEDLNSLFIQRNAILGKLKDWNIASENINLQESKTSMIGNVSFKDLNYARSLYSQIGASLMQKGVLAKIYQPAKLAVYQLVDESTNAITEVPNSEIDAEVTPTHAVDENVSVKVQLAVQRGKLVYAQAIEPQ
ncbi:MAG: hypothetical protein WC602_04645 [archaeon]